MAKSSADDEELRRACEAAIEGTKQKIVMSIRVTKSRGIWGKSGKLGRGHMAKPRIPFQLGLSKMDLRKVVKSSLSGVDKSISVMYKKLQKNLTSEDLLPSLWDKCKKEFLDKYDSFAQLVAKIYPTETIPSVAEMREHLASM